MPLLSVRQVEKYYGNRSSLTKALDSISFDVEAGEFVAVMGPSGSGKTTLLNCVSTIDRVTSGRILLDGEDATALRGADLNRFRRDRLGFIFQDFSLLDTLTAYENIALPLSIRKTPPERIDDAVKTAAEQLDVADVLAEFPWRVARGQQQRVAAARAIVTEPKLILADEPTGALDSRSAKMLLERLCFLNAERGATIMMVTHDSLTASYASRVLFIKDGKLFHELNRGGDGRREFFDRIIDVITLMGGEAGRAL